MVSISELSILLGDQLGKEGTHGWLLHLFRVACYLGDGVVVIRFRIAIVSVLLRVEIVGVVLLWI